MIQIIEGLFEGQVLQRSARGVSDARFAGTCAASGAVWAGVFRGGRPLRGKGFQKVGVAARGKLKGRLAGIPAGGPYEVRLCVGRTAKSATDAVTIAEVWVGDVWILGGQSNMQGCGERSAALSGITPVRAFYMDDRWAVAHDPIHNLWNAVDPVHGGTPDGKDGGGKGVGPGVSFGQAMYAYTGVPQGLIACGHGGTSMAQWDPMHKNLGGYSLYGATVRRFRKLGGRVAGIVWYQGESDSMVKAVEEYIPRMQDLVRAFRRDFGDAKLPFVLVQLARYAGENQTPECWNLIQDHQRRLAVIIPQVSTVPAIDLALDDLVHVGGRGQQVLGVRLAEAMYALRNPGGELKAPIALKRVSVAVPKGEQLSTITVEFDNVVGKLESMGRPMGFSVRLGQEHKPGVFDTRLAGSTVQLKTFRTMLDFICTDLYYGHGLDPACNIMDSAGRPLPVFGPIPITKMRLAMPFPKALLVSRMLPGAGKLAAVELPADLASLELVPRVLESNFFNLYPEFSKLKEDALAFIVGRFACAEPMKLAALFGYDGPVKLWVDGKLLRYDPHGTNPAVPDHHAVSFQAGKGTHEMVIALGSNEAKAWGVYLRIERIGVTPKQIEKNPSRYPVPQWVG